MTTRALALHRYAAAVAGAGSVPLLFIHGGYANSRVWQANFIPYFRKLGHDCYALDLSGHGDSAGRERLHKFGLDDYAADLTRTLADLERRGIRPILVSHSMGCIVSQRHLERGTARGVVLLAPVPPIGTAGAAARLAASVPEFFAELTRAATRRPTPRTIGVMSKMYFSPLTDEATIAQCLPMIQEESERAVAEMLTLALRPAHARSRPPALVIGGSRDAVFPPDLLHFTAIPWRAKWHVVGDAGHMLMLDPQWSEVAAIIRDWLGGETAP